ncbi:hypothetical protein D8Y22_04570 [Salinadaptatus halalkaliphilus]|uniref:DUF7511 domain-containing protein n=1 Tax=Salinadaptatus halalkaliphilus TaxID=2419781 RepID=A0A4S3TPG2_9EURY|nr:hypothetical protein [Salinadaptatus halalkaliphilus]THE66191.1 hypothetical protein D8Y22_04570 [Salinadaptatus halalkaliphilus]
MSVHDAPISDDDVREELPLELLTDDGEMWTAVPIDASGDQRVSQWLSVDRETVCDLEVWR